MALTKVTGQVIKNTTDVTVGVLTVTNTLAVGGTVSIGGTLTYEDVTNVDAVGLITARNGIVVGSGITLSKDGDVFFTGIATGNGSGLTALNASNIGSGTVPTARLGSGTASSSTFLRGDSTFAAVTSTTINSNADNRLITGSGTANTLNGESALTFDGATLDIDGGSNDTPLILDTSATAGSHLRFRKDGSNVHFVGSGGGFSLGDAEDLSLRGYDNILFATGNSSTERVRISSSGNFGIGSNNPQVLLHIASATPTLRIHDTTNNFYSHISVDDSGSLTLDGDAGNGAGSSRIVFKTDGSEHARITSDGVLYLGPHKTSTAALNVPYEIRVAPYGWSAAQDIAAISMGNHSGATGNDDGEIVFKTGKNVHTDANGLTEKVRINSSGQVLIGADTQGSADGFTNNFMIAETGGSAGMSIQSYTSASSYTTIALGDRTVHNRGYIEQRCGDNNPMTIGLTGNGSIRFTGKNTSSGNLVERARITSDGLCFHGDTAATNALDDYEEGTFTATCANSVTLYSTEDLCAYTKIGRQVTVRGQVRINSDNGNADLTINNLPFANVNDGEGSNAGTGAVRTWGINFGGGDTNGVIAFVSGSSSSNIEFWRNINNGGAERVDAKSGGYVAFTVTYFTST